ncbi:hypothetical protein BLOT_000190 [Blomia tropicalis]|nr:hypothetical protein BLOT_000190 [Blomia tropicalis]
MVRPSGNISKAMSRQYIKLLLDEWKPNCETIDKNNFSNQETHSHCCIWQVYEEVKRSIKSNKSESSSQN